MKDKLFFAITLLIGALAAVGLSSCNSSDDTYTTPRYLDIVTVNSTGPEGLVMTVYKPFTSTAATLTSDRTVSGDHLPVGSRIVISYSAEQGRYVSGPIELFAAVPTVGLGAEIPVASYEEISAVRSEAIQVPEFGVTAHYLDFDFQAITAATTTVKLTLDEATLEDEYPKAYLTVVTPAMATTLNQLYYGSYDLQNLMGKSNFRGLEIFYNQTGGALTSTKVTPAVSGGLKPSQND